MNQIHNGACFDITVCYKQTLYSYLVKYMNKMEVAERLVSDFGVMPVVTAIEYIQDEEVSELEEIFEYAQSVGSPGYRTME